jgi:hypothetical protein
MTFKIIHKAARPLAAWVGKLGLPWIPSSQPYYYCMPGWTTFERGVKHAPLSSWFRGRPLCFGDILRISPFLQTAATSLHAIKQFAILYVSRRLLNRRAAALNFSFGRLLLPRFPVSSIKTSKACWRRDHTSVAAECNFVHDNNEHFFWSRQSAGDMVHGSTQRKPVFVCSCNG